jgi:hypothetical protein
VSTILDQITVGDIKLQVLDAEPTSGHSAEVGSLAIVPSLNKLYFKKDILDTDWQELVTLDVLTEAAQDAVGNALTNSANITFTYNDGANTLSADLTDLIVASTNGSASKTVSVTVDAKGRVTALVDQDILITASQISDFSAALEAHLGFNVAKSSAATTTNANTDLVSLAIPANSSALVKAFVSGLSAANSAVAYERTALVKNVGGTVSVHVPQSDYTAEESPLGPSNVNIMGDGANVVVRLNGTSGQTINWKGSVQVHKP